jgi:Mn2+/Fe2+ NRAMP family transporter
VGLILLGRYGLFERLMKIFIAVMFVTVIVCAILIRPDAADLARGLASPSVPLGSGPFLLGVIGGVGGSVTLLSYSYWIRERGWEGPSYQRTTRLDLGAAYGLTGLFGLAMIVIAADVKVEAISGDTMALSLADRIGEIAGPAGRLMFLIGFWGAVATSMLGVWQGVPYIFADLLRNLRRTAGGTGNIDTASRPYRWYLVFIAVPPMVLLLIGQPVWILLIYTITGAFFMPFLAATLLYLNNRAAWVQGMRNGWVVNGLLIVALAVFGYLCVNDIAGRL